MNEARSSVEELPRSAWPSFFERFTDRHQGWIVTVRMLEPSGSMIEARGAPFRRIGFVGPSDDTIRIETSSSRTVLATIRDPGTLVVHETRDGAGALRIVSENGTMVFLILRTGTTPEHVDIVR